MNKRTLLTIAAFISLAHSGTVSAKVYETIQCQAMFTDIALTFEDARQSTRYQGIDCRSAAFGFESRETWMKISIPSDVPLDQLLFLELWYRAMDFVDIYIPDHDSTAYKLYEVGDLRPFENRPIPTRGFVIPYKKSGTNTGADIFVRIKTSGSLQLPVKLMDPPELSFRTSVENLLFGLYYGIILAMIIYNLFLFVTIRDQTYLFYVLYVTFYLLFQVSLNGYGVMYLWQDALEFANKTLPIFIFAMFAFMYLFSSRFLLLRSLRKNLDHAVIALAGLSLCGAMWSIYAPLSQSLKTVVFFSIISAIVVWVIGFYSTIKGFKPARYFLIAWSTFLMGILIISFKNFGLLPSNFVTDYSMQIGSALETLLLSIALGYRIKSAEDKRALAENRARTLEAEADKNAAIAATVQMVAHDVRAPFETLKRIISQLELNTGSKERDALKKGRKSVEGLLQRVETMISDILDVSREIKPRDETIGSSTLIEVAIDEISSQGLLDNRRGDIQLTLAYDVDITGTIQKLKRSIQNIIINALEATRPGNRITVSVAKDPGRSENCQIIIRNEGSYISENELEKVFDKFFSSGKEQGTGLGLAITKNVIEAHGGTIRCKSSSSGSQTEFIISLPTAAAKIEATMVKHACLPINHAQLSGVVLVDDDIFVREAWSVTAKKRGFRLWTFSHPDELLKNIHRYSPESLIFVDYYFDGTKISSSSLKSISTYFNEVYLCTDLCPDHFTNRPEGIKAVLNKDFPLEFSSRSNRVVVSAN